jgi:hypothetical protein
MATTPARIFVNGDAHVYVGPPLTAAPSHPQNSAANPFDPALIEVGLFTDDSLNFSTDPNFETVTSHQSNYPTRRMQTADEATLSVDLQEWSGPNFTAAFGGGDIVEVSSGVWKYTPPSLGQRDEVMVVVECIDGAKHYTLVIPRAMQVEGVEQDLGKGTESILPLRLAILGSGDTDPWYWLSDDNSAWSGSVPTISTRTPTQGTAAGGVAVVVSGVGLGAVSGVKFGDTDTGVLTGVPTTTSLPASAETWTVDQWKAPHVVRMTSGTQSGVSRAITSNTADTLTTAAFPAAPAAGDAFVIEGTSAAFYTNTAGTQLTATSPAGTSGLTVDMVFTHTVSGTPVTKANWHEYTA